MSPKRFLQIALMAAVLTIIVSVPAALAEGFVQQRNARETQVKLAMQTYAATRAPRKVSPVPATAAPTPTPSPSVAPTPTPVPPTPKPTPLPPVEPLATPVRILMYHYIRPIPDAAVDPGGVSLSISPEMFDQQVALLASNNYRFITMNQVVTNTQPTNVVALTFDDGYEDFYTDAFPTLKKYGATGTLYVIVDFVGRPGYVTWEQLSEMAAAGIEIGSHTLSHRSLSSLSLADQRKELLDSRAILEQHLGMQVLSFCYPSGRYTYSTAKLAKEVGYTSAVTTISGTAKAGQDLFQLPRVRMSPSGGVNRALERM